VKSLLALSLIPCLLLPSVALAGKAPVKATSKAVKTRKVVPARTTDPHGSQRQASKAKGPFKGRVTVTGSHIPRKPGTLLASPVITLTRKDIRRNGHTTLCGALRQVPEITVQGCP
jgi:hypothetical protein